MANKWNFSASEQYAKNFAKLICDEFFSDDDAIGGTQILNLTEIRQINLLIIKNLYAKWELETDRIRSPYFDFTHPEVVDIFNDFKNILSRHIAIKREQFEPLLTKAVEETLLLLHIPEDYYCELLRDLPNFQLTQDWIKSVSKYLPVNHWILEKLSEKLGEQKYVFANEAIDWTREICKSGEFDDTQKNIAAMNSILALPINLIEIEQPVQAAIPFEEAKPKKITSFFDEEVAEISRMINKNHEPKQFVPEPVVVESPPVAVIEEKPKEIFVEPIKYSEPVVETPVAPTPVTQIIEQKKVIEEVRLNEKFNQDQKTLNDGQTSGRNNTLLDYHQKSKIENIRAAISLNQRFLFINNLFSGNVEAFSHALDELEACSSFSDARDVMLKKYVPRYLWDVTSAEAEEFIDIVKRRFS